MSVCGLWPTRTRLIAVIVDDDGRARHPITAETTREACTALLTWLATTTVEALVLTERSGPLIELARAVKLRVAIAPHDLLDAIRDVAALSHRPARHTAAVLARWYLTPKLRRYLREIRPCDHHPNQIRLL